MKNCLMNNTTRDMKNSLKQISLFLFVLAMSIGSGYATNAAGTYTLQNTGEITAGKYVICIMYNSMKGAQAFASSSAHNMSTVAVTMSPTSTAYTTNGATVTITLDGTENICEFTIAKSGSYYTINDGTYFLSATTSSTDNYCLPVASANTYSYWTIEQNIGAQSYKGTTIKNKEYSSITKYYLGQSSGKLSCYSSAGNIYLFKLSDPLYNINLDDSYAGYGNASMDARVGGVSVTRAVEGATVTLSQTANPNYRFAEWLVYNEDWTSKVTVTNNQFTMPAYDVWVYPTYDPCSTDATITAASSESISQTTATVRCAGGISNKGDSWCAITEYGFVISAKSANENPEIGGSGVTKHQIGTSYSTLNTAFSKALTGLTASTTYCVRAYATNGHGTAYSAVHEFTTAAEVTFGNYVITCDDYHTVTYNKNTTADITGSLPTDANEYSSGQTVYVSNGTISRTGYDFVGWNTNASATEGITEFVMGASDVTLYAVWSPIDYTLTMATAVGGGAGTATSNAAITAPRTGAGDVANKHYGEEITVTVVAPAHHTFTGWTSSNGGTFANASALSTTFTMPAGNTTITASFTEDTKYIVTWSDNGETTEEEVYSGETATFPALANGCDLYVAAGWTTSSFAAESLDKPASFWAVGATTPAVTADVTYKAVYRHKYYTTDEFVNGTTDGEGYYLYALYSDTKYYKTTYNGSDGFNSATSKGSAVPVYLEKVEDSYYIRDVNTDNYYYGNSGTLKSSANKSATDAYKWTFSNGLCEPSRGDYKVVNEADKTTKTLLLNSSGGSNAIKEYGQTGDCPAANYYHLNLEPAYYYKYSPTAACYDIQVTSNAWANGTFQTLSGSSPKYLVGNELTVTPQCGYHISSVSITGGTYTSSSSGRSTTYIITPSAACTFTVNFTTAQSNADKNTISFLDGSTVIGQTKTEVQYECGSYSLPDGYNTDSREGACDGWTFDGWTATNYTYGQMAAPSDIQAAGSSQSASGDKTWYAVYHKTFAAGAYFKLKYGTKYVSGYSSNQFTTSETEADGLMFGLENDYLYYIDKTTRGKVWVYYVNSTGQNVTIDTNKPTSNTYKTTFTENSGTYEIKCNGRWLEHNGSGKVYFYASTTPANRGTRPDASGFTAYYPKTDCAIEYVTVTYDAGAGNSCTPASVTVESGSTFTLPVEADITYDKSDWTFVGWSAGTVQGVVPGAPGDLIAGGGSYSTFTDVTLHAVYSQTPPDGTFNNSKGGKYIIWGEEGDIRYYAKSNGQTKGKLSNTLNCSEAAIFEFVETETAGQYKIHIVGEEKYFAGEGCGDSQTDFTFVSAGSAPAWTVEETATADVWKMTSSCGTRGFIMETGGSKIFGHYSSNNTITSPGTYKNIHIGQCDDYYTTNPNKALSVIGNVLVTSTNGRMVMAKDQLTINASNIGSDAPVTITSNSSDVYFSTTRAVNISKAEKPTTSVTINANGEGNITNQTVYVHYMPSVATDGIEEVLVTVTSPEKTVEHTIKVRHLPATFAIAAKVGKNWYALTGNMSGAKTPAAIQIEVDESSWTAYAPDTCAYQLWPVKTTDQSGDRYTTQGEKVRFSAVNNKTTANAGLWANNSAASNTINNSAAITAITSDPPAQYEWKIAATEVSGTWKYTLQMEAGSNNNKLNIHRDANLVWGTYTDGQAVTSDIYLLPISEITPFEFQVVEWYPTKVLIQTEAALASPTVKIAGAAVASPVLTNKGGKLWEISGLSTLASNPAELLKINYTKDAVTYSGIKSIPVIISRSTQNVKAEPFTTLTKEVYNYADLVVRDGTVLTVNGTEAENKFYDVTIYPTSKISVPESKKLGVHSLTFFGGIDEIYNGSTYTMNKYGVPELSLKGQFGTKTVTTIDYVMRVNLDQMYQMGVPYDVNLSDITYWDGTAMTPGTNLYVSTYDGQARVNKESKTWIWEEDFESKLGAATLKAGVGYTISAEPQSGVGSEYSIIRMPMTGNVAAYATEAAKTVPVVAYANTKGATVGDNNKGWNYLSNPYMVSISGSTAGGATDSKLVVGYLRETGTGPWEWVDDDYRYVTIPHDDGTDYYQQKFSAATLKPFKSFFLQIANNGDLSFALTSRQNAPARYLEVKEREVEFEVLLNNGARQDNTGLLIAEKYSPAYEINADLEKMIGAMSIYTIYGGYNLAYNALSPADAEQLIPVGYVAPAAGEYTFLLDEQSDYGQIEHIYLTDYEQSRTVDLLDDTYVFTTDAGKNESRFAINVILKEEIEEIVTGIDEVDAESELPLKFIYEDKMYILRGGVIYDATGKKVGEIK